MIKLLKVKNNLIVSIVLLTQIVACHYGAGVGEKTNTPKEFLSHITISKKNYSEDSAKIIMQLREYLVNHEQSFYNKEYSDSTELSIDTILYNSEFNKLAFFVISKTQMYRRKEASQDKRYSHWYDAFCYLGIRSQISGEIKLKWVRRFYSINWYDKAETSSAIRDDYFTEFSTIKDASGVTYQYKYNLNDRRFWDCPIWMEYFK